MYCIALFEPSPPHFTAHISTKFNEEEMFSRNHTTQNTFCKRFCLEYLESKAAALFLPHSELKQWLSPFRTLLLGHLYHYKRVI